VIAFRGLHEKSIISSAILTIVSRLIASHVSPVHDQAEGIARKIPKHCRTITEAKIFFMGAPFLYL
jgi:hypothetical protein